MTKCSADLYQLQKLHLTSNKPFYIASKDNVGPFEIGARIMEKLVLVPSEKYQRLLDGKTMEKKTPNPPKRRERTVLKKKGPPGGTG